MKTYIRALDYTVLALNELSKGKHVLAARLLAQAVKEPDLPQAIATLEASNKYAFALEAGATKARVVAPQKTSANTRLTAAEDFPFDPTIEADADTEFEDDEELDAEFDGDPLAELEDEDTEEDVAPAQAMARVLSSMVTKRTR